MLYQQISLLVHFINHEHAPALLFTLSPIFHHALSALRSDCLFTLGTQTLRSHCALFIVAYVQHREHTLDEDKREYAEALAEQQRAAEQSVLALQRVQAELMWAQVGETDTRQLCGLCVFSMLCAEFAWILVCLSILYFCLQTMGNGVGTAHVHWVHAEHCTSIKGDRGVCVCDMRTCVNPRAV